jgi:hypothetical protein
VRADAIAKDSSGRVGVVDDPLSTLESIPIA